MNLDAGLGPSSRVRHGIILSRVSVNILGEWTNYLTPVKDFNNFFVLKILSRDEWKENNIVSTFTAGSNADTGTRTGIFYEDFYLSVSLWFSDTYPYFRLKFVLYW